MSRGDIERENGDEVSDPEFKKLLETVESKLQPRVAAINGDEEPVRNSVQQT